MSAQAVINVRRCHYCVGCMLPIYPGQQAVALSSRERCHLACRLDAEPERERVTWRVPVEATTPC